MRRGSGRPDHRVGLESSPPAETRLAALERFHLRAELEPDAASPSGVRHPADEGFRRTRKDGRGAIEERHAGPTARLGAEPRLEAEGQLDATRARADHQKAKRLASSGSARPRDQRLDARDESLDRPDGEGMQSDAGQVAACDAGSHVERRDVVGQLAPGRRHHPPAPGIDAADRFEHDLRPGPARERDGVDREVRGSVLPGHEARQHPRVDRRIAVDGERELGLRLGSERGLPQHLDVRGTSSDQQDTHRRIPDRPSSKSASAVRGAWNRSSGAG